MQGEPNQFRRRLPVGAEFSRDGRVHFRVWAPKCKRVEIVLPRDHAIDNDVSLELEPEGAGYYSATATGPSAGTLYGFRLDGDRRLFPDPASRFQPQGPTGLSQLVDPRSFRWSDNAGRGVSSRGHVLYEMPIGTFSREGTWQAAAPRLREPARAGITIIETMPVADFPGEFGWDTMA